MGIGNIDSAQVAFLGASRKGVAKASSRSERWCREARTVRTGVRSSRAPQSVSNNRREAAELMIGGREIRRAYHAFWCEGHLGDWNGLCGHRVLGGEGYVQSGDYRLCLSCAEIEAKRVAVSEEAFAPALLEDVKEVIAAPLQSAWNLGASASPSSAEEEQVVKRIEEAHPGSGTMSAAQALVSENEQLAKLARSQEAIARILEDERRHRERLAGDFNRSVLLLRDEPVDEELALLVEGIVEEVAVIGALCDTLRDRLESVTTGPEHHGR
jgi:hypothetical protein